MINLSVFKVCVHGQTVHVNIPREISFSSAVFLGLVPRGTSPSK